MSKRVAVAIQINADLFERLERLRDAEHRPSMSNTIVSVIERAMSRMEAIERGDSQIDIAAIRGWEA